MNVGIFWFYQDQNIANKIQTSLVQPDDLGIIDSVLRATSPTSNLA